MSNEQVIRIGDAMNLGALLAKALETGKMVHAELNADGSLSEKKTIFEDVSEAGSGQTK